MRDSAAAELPSTHPACPWHRGVRHCCGAAGCSPGCWVWSPRVGRDVGLVLLLAPVGSVPFPGKFGGAGHKSSRGSGNVGGEGSKLRAVAGHDAVYPLTAVRVALGSWHSGQGRSSALIRITPCSLLSLQDASSCFWAGGMGDLGSAGGHCVAVRAMAPSSSNPSATHHAQLHLWEDMGGLLWGEHLLGSSCCRVKGPQNL